MIKLIYFYYVSFDRCYSILFINFNMSIPLPLPHMQICTDTHIRTYTQTQTQKKLNNELFYLSIGFENWVDALWSSQRQGAYAHETWKVRNRKRTQIWKWKWKWESFDRLLQWADLGFPQSVWSRKYFRTFFKLL